MQCTGIWPPMPEDLAQPEPKPSHLVMRLPLDPESCDNSTHLDNSQERGLSLVSCQLSVLRIHARQQLGSPRSGRIQRPWSAEHLQPAVLESRTQRPHASRIF